MPLQSQHNKKILFFLLKRSTKYQFMTAPSILQNIIKRRAFVLPFPDRFRETIVSNPVGPFRMKLSLNLSRKERNKQLQYTSLHTLPPSLKRTLFTIGLYLLAETNRPAKFMLHEAPEVIRPNCFGLLRPARLCGAVTLNIFIPNRISRTITQGLPFNVKKEHGGIIIH